MSDTDFTVTDFLRAIRKGPEERPDWWRENYFVRDGCIPMCPREFICISPFTDILDAWTPDKDALLLGAGLEYARRPDSNHHARIYSQLEKQWPGHSVTECYGPLDWFLLMCDRPGLTLARAIWAALKGGGQ